MEGVNPQAAAEMRETLDEKARRWSKEVKIRDGWACEDCGELDKQLLEAHHIKPKHLFPQLMYQLDNGKCVCMWCHAKRHKLNPIICCRILARLATILYKRLYPGKEF